MLIVKLWFRDVKNLICFVFIVNFSINLEIDYANLRDSLLDQVRTKIPYCLNLLCPHPSYIWTMDIQETAFAKTAKKTTLDIINNLKLMFVEYEKSIISANTILPFRDPLIRI